MLAKLVCNLMQGAVRSPFLNIGTTQACRQSVGTYLSSIQRELKPLSTSAAVCRVKAGIKSGPVALSICRFFRSLRTPSSPTWRSSGPVALSICRFFRSLRTPSSPTWMSSIAGKGLSPLSGMRDVSSVVKAVRNCSFKISAFLALLL
eukprot:TRINITY_DN69357_c0_g1_i9.p1 TRINITY_DN69357_c0_g1~~TRINITY_DN69357_c0_g1_i9.p1  ORF type:complete len:148 (+),score=8.49 TRINITY_DN69357_c0_g1_i9:196-639(+)